MANRLFAKQKISIKRVILAIALALTLMVLDRNNPEWFAGVRNFSHAAMQPIYQVSIYPNFISNWLASSSASKTTLVRQNKQLQLELDQAKLRLQQLDFVAAQNARLTELLTTPNILLGELILVRVIGIDSNPVRQVLVINRGKKDGVFVGQLAVDSKGIVGQVLNVYNNTSRVLLISDERQSVSVMIKRSNQKAILTGSGVSDYLNLQYINKSSDIRVGDTVISSGLGERIPGGFVLGRISYIDRSAEGDFAAVKVKPASDLTQTNYIFLIKPNATDARNDDVDIRIPQLSTAMISDTSTAQVGVVDAGARATTVDTSR